MSLGFVLVLLTGAMPGGPCKHCESVVLADSGDVLSANETEVVEVAPAVEPVAPVNPRLLEPSVSSASRRSTGPYWLFGGAGVVAMGAVFAGFVATRTAAVWNEGCPDMGPCEAGFTRQRYEDDRARIDAERQTSNALWGLAAVTAVSAVVWYLLERPSAPVVASP